MADTAAQTPTGRVLITRREYRVTRADLVRYAGASGDFNPIHWSDRVAKGVELPGVIGHGMLTMALAARSLTDWAGDPGAVVEYSTRFSRPVVVPDDVSGVAVEVSGEVIEVRTDGMLEVALTVRVDGDKVLTQARAVVKPPKTE